MSAALPAEILKLAAQRADRDGVHAQVDVVEDDLRIVSHARG